MNTTKPASTLAKTHLPNTIEHAPVCATPGPWVVCEQYTDRAVFPIGYECGDGAIRILAEVNSCSGTPDKQRANAALIASAPMLQLTITDLHEHIRNLVARIAELQRECDELRQSNTRLIEHIAAMDDPAGDIAAIRDGRSEP